jgi:hypothetical protein
MEGMKVLVWNVNSCRELVTYHMHSNYPPAPKHFLQELHNLWTEAVGKGYIYFCLQLNKILAVLKINIQITEFKNLCVM